MAMDNTKQDWNEEKINKLIDAYCRISVAEYSEDEQENFFEIKEATTYDDIEKYLSASKNKIEYVKLFSLNSKEPWERKLNLLLRIVKELDIEILLLVPIGKLNIVKNALELQVYYQIRFHELLKDVFDSSCALLTISDRHKEYYLGLNYIKVLNNGQLKIVEDDQKLFKYNIYYLTLETDLFEEIKQYVNETVTKRIKSKYGLIVDDRCFMSAFCLKYHTKWLGIENVNRDIDLYDYFENTHSADIIRKIMELPLVRAHFSDLEAKKKLFI